MERARRASSDEGNPRSKLRRVHILAFILVALAASAAFSPQAGPMGMALGLAGAGVGVAGLIFATKLAGAAATAGAKPGLGVVATLFVFIIKVPLLYALWTVAQSLGGSAPGCFLAGVLLVYSGLVAWAVSR